MNNMYINTFVLTLYEIGFISPDTWLIVNESQSSLIQSTKPFALSVYSRRIIKRVNFRTRSFWISEAEWSLSET